MHDDRLVGHLAAPGGLPQVDGRQSFDDGSSWALSGGASRFPGRLAGADRRSMASVPEQAKPALDQLCRHQEHQQSGTEPAHYQDGMTQPARRPWIAGDLCTCAALSCRVPYNARRAEMGLTRSLPQRSNSTQCSTGASTASARCIWQPMFAVATASGPCSVSAAALRSRSSDEIPGLQDGVGTGGAAAQVRVADGDQFVAGAGQQALDEPRDLLAVLQRARRVPGDAVDVGSLVEGEAGQEFRDVGDLGRELGRGFCRTRRPAPADDRSPST